MNMGGIGMGMGMFNVLLFVFKSEGEVVVLYYMWFGVFGGGVVMFVGVGGISGVGGVVFGSGRDGVG